MCKSKKWRRNKWSGPRFLLQCGGKISIWGTHKKYHCPQMPHRANIWSYSVIVNPYFTYEKLYMLNKLDGVRQSSWKLWVPQSAHTLSTSSIVCIFSKLQRFCWGVLIKYIFTTFMYNLNLQYCLFIHSYTNKHHN